MYETSNDLASTTRRSAIELLNEHLADATDLHTTGGVSAVAAAGIPLDVGDWRAHVQSMQDSLATFGRGVVHEQFAEELLLHAQSEEEVLYPAAILVGDIIRARTAAK